MHAPLTFEKIYTIIIMQSRTQPISQRTRSRRIIMQESGSNGVLHITLRSSVRGLGGLIISIPQWNLEDEGDDE